MVTYENRQKLKEKLPKPIKTAYSLINEKLPELSRKQIERSFNTKCGKHYREDVIAAALIVIEEAEKKALKLNQKVNQIVTS